MMRDTSELYIEPSYARHTPVKEKQKARPGKGSRNRKKVVALDMEGNLTVYSSIANAAKWCDMNVGNVCRCCQANFRRHVNKKTGKVNTDHKYKGNRFYYEADPIWTTKLKKI